MLYWGWHKHSHGDGDGNGDGDGDGSADVFRVFLVVMPSLMAHTSMTKEQKKALISKISEFLKYVLSPLV